MTDEELLSSWYAANNFPSNYANYGLRLPTMSTEQAKEFNAAKKRYAVSGKLDNYNTLEYAIPNAHRESYNSVKNTVNFLNSERGMQLASNIAELRDKFEVSKLISQPDGMNRLRKWILLRNDRTLKKMDSMAEKQKFVQEQYSKVKNWVNEYGTALANSDNYIIEENPKTGKFEYVLGNPKTNQNSIRTTGELVQAIAVANSKNGYPMTSKDLASAINYGRTGHNGKSGSFANGINYQDDGSYSSGGSALEALIPRSYEMLSDDEFESKYGGMTKAIIGDVGELMMGLIPTGKIAYHVAQKGLTLAPKLLNAFDKAEKAVNRFERMNHTAAVGSKFAKGAVENSLNLAGMDVAGNLYDSVQGTNRGSYTYQPVSYAVAAALGGLGKTFGKYPKTRNEMKKDIFKYIQDNSKNGGEWINEFKGEDGGWKIQSWRDISDELVDVWSGDNMSHATDFLNSPMFPFNEETVRVDKRFFPKSRLDRQTVETVDPEAIQLASRTADDVNAANKAEWEKEWEKTFENNQNSILNSEHQQNLINGRNKFRAEMEVEQAYDDMVAEAQNEFEKAVSNDAYWRDRFEKSNADYQRVFWDWIRGRWEYQDVLNRYNHLKELRTRQNAPYTELGLPPRKPNEVQKPKSNETLESVAKDAGATFDETLDWTPEELQMLLDKHTLQPNAEAKVRQLLHRKRNLKRDFPNLAEGETRQQVEKKVDLPTIPQKVSDNQSISTGGYEASQRRLSDAKKELADAKSTPIGEVSVDEVKVEPSVNELPAKPEEVGFDVAGNQPTITNPATGETKVVTSNSPTGRRKVAIRTQSYNDAPMTEDEFQEYCETHWKLFPWAKSADDLYHHHNREGLKAILSESYKRGAKTTEPITDAEWYAFCEDNWREIGGDRLIDGKRIKGKYKSAEDMYNDPKARLDFDNKYTHLYQTNRIVNSKPAERSEHVRKGGIFDTETPHTEAEIRSKAASYDQNAKDDAMGGKKDKALADFMRIAYTIEDPAKEEAFRKAAYETWKRHEYMGGIPQGASKHNPDFAGLGVNDDESIVKAAIPTKPKHIPSFLGREAGSQFDYMSAIPTALNDIHPTDPDYINKEKKQK